LRHGVVYDLTVIPVHHDSVLAVCKTMFVCEKSVSVTACGLVCYMNALAVLLCICVYCLIRRRNAGSSCYGNYRLDREWWWRRRGWCKQVVVAVTVWRERWLCTSLQHQLRNAVTGRLVW